MTVIAMKVYQIWEIDPFTAIKNVHGTFKDRGKAEETMEECMKRFRHTYFYVSEEDVIE